MTDPFPNFPGVTLGRSSSTHGRTETEYPAGAAKFQFKEAARQKHGK